MDGKDLTTFESGEETQGRKTRGQGRSEYEALLQQEQQIREYRLEKLECTNYSDNPLRGLQQDVESNAKSQRNFPCLAEILLREHNEKMEHAAKHKIKHLPPDFASSIVFEPDWLSPSASGRKRRTLCEVSDKIGNYREPETNIIFHSAEEYKKLMDEIPPWLNVKKKVFSPYYEALRKIKQSTATLL